VYADMAHALVHVGPRERTASLREEVEALLASEPSDKRVRAQLLMFLGFAAGSEFDYDRMESSLEQALALHRELGDARSISECLLSLGYVAIGRDDPGGAARFEEGLRYQKELKHMTAIFMGVSGMAGIAALRGDPFRSARLMGASEALRERIGFTIKSLSKARYDYEKYLARVRGALGEAALGAAFSEGRAMSPEQAIEYALSEGEEREPTTTRVTAPEQQPPADEPTERLTPREREVALLVGRELTNRQIASELSISEHTVANHVAKILKKLGLRSRAQIGARLMMVPSYELYCSGASIFERLADVF
jgi:DNA-binding CsgD family transcriptional regulator